MIRGIIISSLILLLATLFSCYFLFQHDPHALSFPTEVRNIEEVNSIYDDMNTLPSDASADGTLCFSSNRNSKGKDFDIVAVSYDYRLGDNYQKETWDTEISNAYKQVPPQINTSTYNEIGPCCFPPSSLSQTAWYKGTNWAERDKFTENLGCFYWFFANDEAGNFNIKFVWSDSFDIYSQKENIPFSKGVAHLLNSSADDCYPTFDTTNGGLYFCSNRGGRFQIYRVAIDYSKDLAATLQKTGEVELVCELSGNGNDKCPYIFNNIMVFTSDRSGGQGGFDLYYSKYNNGSWSKPANMGEKINSPKDEYRPIVNEFSTVVYGGKQSNDLLIFSSNREGGKGGFDLYQVGTDIFRK